MSNDVAHTGQSKQHCPYSTRPVVYQFMAVRQLRDRVFLVAGEWHGGVQAPPTRRAKSPINAADRGADEALIWGLI